MNPRLASAFLVAFAAVAPLASSQVASIVGPQIVPSGCPVSISISNDTALTLFTGVCPYQVIDGGGAVVFTPICIAIAQILNPGDTFSTQWDQTDDNGNPVPPGNYVVQVQLPGGGGSQQHAITIGGADAGVAPLGVPKIGTSRSYQLCSPLDGSQFYLMAAAGSSNVGIPTCGGVFPLDPDPIFEASLSDPTVFINTFGSLDAAGLTKDPTVAIPANPNFVGLQVHFAMMVLDFAAPCPFRRFSAPMIVTLS